MSCLLSCSLLWWSWTLTIWNCESQETFSFINCLSRGIPSQQQRSNYNKWASRPIKQSMGLSHFTPEKYRSCLRNWVAETLLSWVSCCQVQTYGQDADTKLPINIIFSHIHSNKRDSCDYIRKDIQPCHLPWKEMSLRNVLKLLGETEAAFILMAKGC